MQKLGRFGVIYIVSASVVRLSNSFNVIRSCQNDLLDFSATHHLDAAILGPTWVTFPAMPRSKS
jgi:hypothetical protein